MLTGVTVTGADDGVDPTDLAAISREFPFVEWGILHSYKRFGEPRYPSLAWRVRLGKLDEIPRLALHVCGQAARDVMLGDTSMLDTLGDEYARVQINGWTPGGSRTAPLYHDKEFILQVRGAEFLQAAADEAVAIAAEAPESCIVSVSALWDCSGGRGVESFSWPPAPLGLRLGYAGGIKPENVLETLSAIGPVSHDFWIDMESGVRTDDRFDLDKVTALLMAVAPFVVDVDAVLSGRIAADREAL